MFLEGISRGSNAAIDTLVAWDKVLIEDSYTPQNYFEEQSAEKKKEIIQSYKEIFFNEVLAQDEINRLFDPKVLTNFMRYTAKGKQPVKEFKHDENGVIRRADLGGSRPVTREEAQKWQPIG
jgi:adenine specific DNA methylase Mod